MSPPQSFSRTQAFSTEASPDRWPSSERQPQDSRGKELNKENSVRDPGQEESKMKNARCIFPVVLAGVALGPVVARAQSSLRDRPCRNSGNGSTNFARGSMRFKFGSTVWKARTLRPRLSRLPVNPPQAYRRLRPGRWRTFCSVRPKQTSWIRMQYRTPWTRKGRKRAPKLGSKRYVRHRSDLNLRLHLPQCFTRALGKGSATTFDTNSIYPPVGERQSKTS